MISNLTRSNRGNALFLILIAVALFAALSYAITQSGRGGGNINNEKLSLEVSRFLGFQSTVYTAAARMLLGGASISGMQFDNNTYSMKDGTLRYGALGNPADPSMYLFHPQGGGVTTQTFTAVASCPACPSNYTMPGHLRFRWTRVPNAGTSTAEAAFYIAYVTLDACNALNKAVGLAGSPLNLDYDTYMPDFVEGDSPPTGLTELPASVSGKMAFCFYNTNTGSGQGYYWVGIMKEY